MQSGRYEPNTEDGESYLVFVKSIAITSILRDNGTISRSVEREVNVYLECDGDRDGIQDTYDKMKRGSMDSEPYFNLLNNAGRFERAQKIAKNRVIPLAKRSGLLGLLACQYKHLKKKKT